LFDFKDNKQKKFYIILMIVIGIFVLGGALFLGLFWNKLFG
jgi:flagellar basal body-associated protein FliL